MEGVRVLRQPAISWTTFQQGMEGWVFKSWMPNGRSATHEVVDTPSMRSPKSLHLFADGRDDDGIFFIETHISADIEGGITTAAIAWWFTLAGSGAIGQWPRVVYLGPPKDLAQQQTQHEFHWFNGLDGLLETRDHPEWFGHLYRRDFDEPLDDIQACIGWKINWETEREFYLDDIVLFAR